MLFGFETDQNTWIYCSFFQIFPMSNLQSYYDTCIKLAHVVLKYIYQFFQIIVLYACDTEVFCLPT